MCENAYEQVSERTGKIMIFCNLKNNGEKVRNEMMKLCICQRFCPDKDKYIPHQQKEQCKFYGGK